MKKIVFLLCLLLCFACGNKKAPQETIISPTLSTPNPTTTIIPEKPYTERYLELLGLIDIQQVDTTILVDLKYATTDNFTKKILYHDLHHAYFQPDVAKKIVVAQQFLQTLHPNFHLLIYDAARPVNVQQTMWETVRETSQSRYVANPEKTGLHNYGAAVDLTIVDEMHIPLDMGTPFDYFGKKASINKEDSLVMQGVLTQQQIENRRLLRKVIHHAGFQTISGEWWHFNACTLNEAKEKYKVIE